MGLVMLIIVGGWYYLQDNLSQWLVPLGEAPTLADAQLAFNAGDLAKLSQMVLNKGVYGGTRFFRA